MKLKLNFLIVFLTVTISSTIAQELDNISWTNDSGIVVVRYDFLKGEEGVDYEFYLYGSHDNFLKPLQETTGDVGKGIQVGAGKAIYWNAQKELGVFKGDLVLKINGDKYVPMVEYKNVHSELKIKRGDPYTFQWKSNSKADQVMLNIESNGVPAAEPTIIDNTGEYLWNIPKDIKPGKTFTIKISDTENPLRAETSSPFMVRRRIPLAYKIVPAVLVAGGIVAIMMKGPEEEGIPAPPEAPNTN